MSIQYAEEMDFLFKRSSEVAIRFNKNEINIDFFLIAALENKCELSKTIDKITTGLLLKNTTEQEYTDSGKELIEYQELPLAEDMQRIIKVIELEMKQGRFKIKKEITSLEFLIAILIDGKLNPSKTMKRLIGLGITLEAIEQVKNETKKTKKPPKKVIEKKKETPVLNTFCRNITQEAIDKKLDIVVGRTDEIQRIIEILGRKKKNNPALIGDAGVGKTAIVEGFAQRIRDRKVPEPLYNKKIFELILTDIIAGTKYRGQFEERIKILLDELKENDDIILFIDEFHTVVGAGNMEGGLDIGNIFKPYLAKGAIQCIGATTPTEYMKTIEKDSALERRFQKVIVDEPSEEETLKILENILGGENGYESYHEVRYSEEALKACVKYSERYITDRFLPDKAIDLLDESGSKVKMTKISSIPKEIIGLKDKIEKNQNEIKERIKTNEFEKCQTLKEENQELEKVLEEEYRKFKKENIPVVEKDDIEDVVSAMTGIPITQISKVERNALSDMGTKLKEIVIGQNEAIDIVVKAIKRNRIDVRDPNRPIGVFMFAGNTGVGKTYLTQQIAKYMFGTEDSLITINMSEYMEKHETSKLIGAPPGYIGHDEGGQLTEKIRRRPYTVILFDEIEKAHPDVFSMFLQIFDGNLFDSFGRKINFKNTIIIMNSNVGTSYNKAVLGFGEKEKNNMKIDVKKAFNKKFPNEFINRIDEVIVFNKLGSDAIDKILDLSIEDLNNRFKKFDVKFELNESVRTIIKTKGSTNKRGARGLKNALRNCVENLVIDAFIDTDIKKGTYKISAENDKINFSIENC